MAGGRALTGAAPQIWAIASFILYLGGAIICAVAAGWVLHSGDRDRPDRKAVIAALCITALWCAMVAAIGPRADLVVIVETLRNLAWTFVLYRLFANDGRDRSLALIRPVVLALAFVEVLHPLLLVFQANYAGMPSAGQMTFQTGSLLRVLAAVGSLVLLHNLYGGASAVVRQALRWSAMALAMLWIYDLNYNTIAYLSGDFPAELSALRGLVIGLVACLLAIGTNQMSAGLRLQPSRAVTFQTLSLLLIGGYLLIMVAIAQSLSMLGGDLARLTQVGFIFLASVFAIIWLPSQRLRGWLRVTTVKHLFQHRYDYRAEWLRFTQTIGNKGEGSPSLFERVVKALADITDSPSGLLLLPDENGTFQLAARWQWQDIEVPASAMSAELAGLLESGRFILDIDDVRQGGNRFGEAALLPQWLSAADSAWALVPLLHFDRLTGAVLLRRPAAPRRLDWEDFDLLRVVGQQLASYLAEQSGHQALMESARFDEFNRRIAFVMHDIKNLASQLALLARNAERHADNPEFRADMLVTLRSSADKLNTLLARLGRYGGQPNARSERVDLNITVRAITARYEGAHPITALHVEDCDVMADPEALEQALVHLVQNAVDASQEGMPVFIDVSCDGLHGRIEIVDSGCGMAPEFIRSGLFKPFVSSKNGGFGIGAFEARELIRSMGGSLIVDSREGLGTRFSIQLPLADAAAGMIASDAANLDPKPDAEVA